MKSSIAIRPDRGLSEFLTEALPPAVEGFALQDSEQWQSLADLSSQTLFEGLSVDPDAIVVQGKDYIAPGRVYVKLQYDPNSSDPVQMSDSYPVRIVFHLSEAERGKKAVIIDRIEPDTSSFYA